MPAVNLKNLEPCYSMRLAPKQITVIKELTLSCFGEGAIVYLFGSRLDDHKKGGDIDLYIETELRDIKEMLDAKLKFLVELKQRIGDQRIDVVLDYPTQSQSAPIIQNAKQTGIRL